jgi:hypothetical protein
MKLISSTLFLYPELHHDLLVDPLDWGEEKDPPNVFDILIEKKTQRIRRFLFKIPRLFG